MTPNAERAMQEVLEKFKSGDLSELFKIAAFEIPNSWPSAKWTMGNKMLAYAQARTLNIRGFQAWKEVKRQVKRVNTVFIFVHHAWSRKKKRE